MKTLTIEIPEGKKAEWVNGVLTLVDEAKAKDNRPVTERIKTFEDACKALGDDAQEVCDYHYVSDNDCASEDVIAYMKLRIITAALNEGWKPRFYRSECRYYPQYRIVTKKEGYFPEENGEAFFLYGSECQDDTTKANVSISSKLCFKTAELALYAGEQFTDIWRDYCAMPRISGYEA